MKRLLLLLLLFYFFSVHAANDTLTRAQVYNFNVGDTFDYKYSTIWGGLDGSGYEYSFYRDVISSIHHSQNMDTLIIVTRHVFPLPASDDTTIYTNLNNIEVYMDNDPSCPVAASYYFDSSSQYNGRATNTVAGSCNNEFDGIVSGLVVANGLGWVVNVYCGGNPDVQGCDSSILIYYSKGTEKWGTPYYGGIPYYDYPTGINESPNIPTVRVYPNPTNNIFFIESGEPISKVEITDVSGRVVQSQTGAKSKMELNAANLSKGIYFCKIYFSQGFTTKKLIVN